MIDDPTKQVSASPKSSPPSPLTSIPRMATWLRSAQPWAEASRIEDAADARHQRQIDLAEHPRHVLRLVGADPVLAGQRAAGFDAVDEDLGGGGLGPLRLAWHALVVTDERMQVAVTGMEDVPDAEAR